MVSLQTLDGIIDQSKPSQPELIEVADFRRLGAGIHCDQNLAFIMQKDQNEFNHSKPGLAVMISV